MIKNKLILIIIFCTTILVSYLIKYAPTNIIINLKSKNLASETKQPINHKYSCWIGNGETLKEYLPSLLTQAKGLKTKNINTYLIVDYKIYNFLKNTKLKNDDHLTISENMKNFNLNTVKAETYIEYCNKTNLQIKLDTNIFHDFQQSTTEPYAQRLYSIYKIHKNNGYKNKKDYALATDILRQIAMQVIGKKDEILLYTDADVDVDYRYINDKVTISNNFIKTMLLFNNHPVAHETFNYKILKKIKTLNLQGLLIFNNDVLLTKAKAPWLDNIFRTIDKMYSTEQKTIAKYFDENDKIKTATIWDLRYNNNIYENIYPILLIKKDQAEELLKITTTTINKKTLEKNKKTFLNVKEKIKNKLIKDKIIRNMLLSNKYTIIYYSQIYLISSAATTVAGITAHKVSSLLKFLYKDNILYYNKVKIIKMLTINTEEIGIIKREDRRSWDKSSNWIESNKKFPTITKTDEFYKKINQTEDKGVNSTKLKYWQILIAKILLPIF